MHLFSCDRNITCKHSIARSCSAECSLQEWEHLKKCLYWNDFKWVRTEMTYLPFWSLIEVADTLCDVLHILQPHWMCHIQQIQYPGTPFWTLVYTRVFVLYLFHWPRRCVTVVSRKWVWLKFSRASKWTYFPHDFWHLWLCTTCQESPVLSPYILEVG